MGESVSRVAVVVPTIRHERLAEFCRGWNDCLQQHQAILLVVWDGDHPTVEHEGARIGLEQVMGPYSDLIHNRNDGVRNLGFAYIAKYLPDVETIITLDDDTLPSGDTIGDHLSVLGKRVPTHWLSTATEYMRGFPYGIREEAEVVLSHGWWSGSRDYDAPTQLVLGNLPASPYVGPIPNGVYYPMCGMNIAFKRKILAYMYFAPMGDMVNVHRFADIWCGIQSKEVIDRHGWAVYSGGATVLHERASNVFANLEREARGIRLNETFWLGGDCEGYADYYRQKRERWESFIHECDGAHHAGSGS